MRPSSKFVLAVTVLGAVGSWLLAAHAWSDLLTPNSVGGLFGSVASVVMAGLHVTPNPKE